MIVAYKTILISPELRVYSWYSYDQWKGSPPQIFAYCKNVNHRIKIPTKRCDCGIYSLKEKDKKLKSYGNTMVCVGLSGKIIEGDKGYKSSEATILGFEPCCQICWTATNNFYFIPTEYGNKYPKQKECNLRNICDNCINKFAKPTAHYTTQEISNHLGV